MVKSKVIFEDEEQVEIKYPCFELKDIVEYYFEIYTPNNSITPFSLVALPNANILVSIYISDSSQTFKVHREHGNRRTKIKKLFCRASSVCRELAFK